VAGGKRRKRKEEYNHSYPHRIQPFLPSQNATIPTLTEYNHSCSHRQTQHANNLLYNCTTTINITLLHMHQVTLSSLFSLFNRIDVIQLSGRLEGGDHLAIACSCLHHRQTPAVQMYQIDFLSDRAYTNTYGLLPLSLNLSPIHPL